MARAKIRKHPVHPMIFPIPMGLWIFAFACDLLYYLGENALWDQIAFYSMAGGIAGALLTAIPGLIDLISHKDSKTKQIGLFHMMINLGAVVLYAFNLWLRYTSPAGVLLPVALSFIGISAIGISGWLGGELVSVYGVGVEPEKGVVDLDEDLRRHLSHNVAQSDAKNETYPRHH